MLKYFKHSVLQLHFKYNDTSASVLLISMFSFITCVTFLFTFYTAAINIEYTDMYRFLFYEAFQ